MDHIPLRGHTRTHTLTHTHSYTCTHITLSGLFAEQTHDCLQQRRRIFDESSCRCHRPLFRVRLKLMGYLLCALSQERLFFFFKSKTHNMFSYFLCVSLPSTFPYSVTPIMASHIDCVACVCRTIYGGCVVLIKTVCELNFPSGTRRKFSTPIASFFLSLEQKHKCVRGVLFIVKYVLGCPLTLCCLTTFWSHLSLSLLLPPACCSCPAASRSRKEGGGRESASRAAHSLLRAAALV